MAKAKHPITPRNRYAKCQSRAIIMPSSTAVNLLEFKVGACCLLMGNVTAAEWSLFISRKKFYLDDFCIPGVCLVINECIYAWI